MSRCSSSSARNFSRCRAQLRRSSSPSASVWRVVFVDGFLDRDGAGHRRLLAQRRGHGAEGETGEVPERQQRRRADAAVRDQFGEGVEMRLLLRLHVAQHGRPCRRGRAPRAGPGRCASRRIRRRGRRGSCARPLPRGRIAGQPPGRGHLSLRPSSSSTATPAASAQRRVNSTFSGERNREGFEGKAGPRRTSTGSRASGEPVGDRGLLKLGATHSGSGLGHHFRTRRRHGGRRRRRRGRPEHADRASGSQPRQQQRRPRGRARSRCDRASARPGTARRAPGRPTISNANAMPRAAPARSATSARATRRRVMPSCAGYDRTSAAHASCRGSGRRLGSAHRYDGGLAQ